MGNVKIHCKSCNNEYTYSDSSAIFSCVHCHTLMDIEGNRITETYKDIWKKEKLRFIKKDKDLNINIKKYEQLNVGFEFEFNGCDATDIAKSFGKRCNHSAGQGEKKVKVKLGSAELTVPVPVDLYKEPNMITDIYPDGSVECEVVTRPVNINRLGLVKRVYDEIKEKGNDISYDESGISFYANGRGGLHMTFLLDHHKELSFFDPLVVKNIIQFVRYFYPHLVEMFGGSPDGTKTRNLSYRQMPTRNSVNNLTTDKYEAINLRKNNDGDIWGLEVRMPDGTYNWKLIEQQVKFWSAVIRQCAIISRFGLLSIPQIVYDLNYNYYQKNTSEFDEIEVSKVYNPYMIRILEGSLQFFGFHVPKESKSQYEIKEKIIENLINGKTLTTIKKELKIGDAKFNKYIQ